ncbi:MAG: N-acetyltransferase [Myxococcales bacterium]|nr:N-acetyltransferase [Myxococcales bacterium]
MAHLTTRVVTSLDGVDAARWDALDHGDSPFLEHGFLRALERSGSIGEESGWRPHYLMVEEHDEQDAGSRRRRRRRAPAPGRLVGAVAAFIKDHSYGEYIFDWAWARASQRAGLAYYPKLVIAAPVTPATGPRLLIAEDARTSREAIVARLVAAARSLADERGCASIHWLFNTAREQAELSAHGFASRSSYQFHWHNHGYGSFDDFLGALTSRRRKQIRKERRRARAAIDDLVFVPGAEVTPDELRRMDRFYRQTVWAHGGMDYLRPGFFAALCELAPERVRIARVRRRGEMIAGALYLQTATRLYGRYWGCAEEHDCLHFETAYYAGVEHCIRERLELFEAGAQGEHKLLRGFAPSLTRSSHWIRHPGLFEGIKRFLEEERRSLEPYLAELNSICPYRHVEDEPAGPSRNTEKRARRQAARAEATTAAREPTRRASRRGGRGDAGAGGARAGARGVDVGARERAEAEAAADQHAALVDEALAGPANHRDLEDRRVEACLSRARRGDPRPRRGAAQRGESPRQRVASSLPSARATSARIGLVGLRPGTTGRRSLRRRRGPRP